MAATLAGKVREFDDLDEHASLPMAVAEAGAAGAHLVVKMGVHAGPCLAVNLNDRLDYFGTTVNTAARIQGESTGGDVVVAAEPLEDPAVRAALTEENVRVEHLDVELRGLREAVRVGRLIVEQEPGKPPGRAVRQQP